LSTSLKDALGGGFEIEALLESRGDELGDGFVLEEIRPGDVGERILVRWLGGRRRLAILRGSLDSGTFVIGADGAAGQEK
jgi:hypothetical protein